MLVVNLEQLNAFILGFIEIVAAIPTYRPDDYPYGRLFVCSRQQRLLMLNCRNYLSCAAG